MQNAMQIITGNEKKKLQSVTWLNVLRYMFDGAPNGFLILVLWELFKPQQTISTAKLIWLIAGMGVVFTITLLLSRAAYTQMHLVAYALTAETRLRLGEHLRKLSMGFYKTHDPGDITALMLQDVDKVETIFNRVYGDVIAAIITPLVTLSFLFFVDWRMALAVIITAPLAFPVMLLAQKVIAYLGGKQVAARNESISRMLEYVQGIQDIKAFNMTGAKFKRLDNSLKTLRDQSIRLEGGAAPFVISYQVVLELSFTVVLLLGAYLLLDGTLTVAIFLIFLVAGYALYRPMQALSLFLAEMRYMNLAAERILAVFEEKPLSEPATPTAPDAFDIEFKGVTFRYGKDDVLKDASFKMPANSMTALVGPSGSGKTTITNLIARFWDTNDGEVLVGGQNVKDLTTESLLESISAIFQDVYLFHDTVLNNIKVGKTDATQEEVIAAAEAAQCHEFIEKLPDGYETMVGEGGSTLSGGEKQRISIARAILKDAPIILLDEATASLDPENEALIQQAINELVKSKTLIIIAHRLSTVVDADQILVLDEGRIVERGKHKDLLPAGGLYSHLWTQQTRARGWKFGSGRQETAKTVQQSN